eukprot:m51a1_g6719 hypothetical protein (112) ;mRNA; r:157476-158090
MTSKVEKSLSTIEESVGLVATRLAETKASSWLDTVWPVIQKKVMDTATRGLFHCQLRFEDDVPLDPVNQARISKLLEKQNLKADFTVTDIDEERGVPGHVTLKIHWGPALL